MCGAIGVSTIASTTGCTIGPPADEVVGGRPGRRRDDQAVGLHARHELLADRHRQVDHPRPRGLGDDHVVQREMLRQGVPPRIVVARSIIRSSMRARAAERRFERRVQLGQRRLGQKSQAAEVDAEDRHVDAPAPMQSGHRSSVPSPPRTDDQIDLADQRGLCRRAGVRCWAASARRSLFRKSGSMPRAASHDSISDEVRHRFAQVRLGDDADSSS